MLNIFSPSLDLLSKVMDFRSLEHDLIAANIANADTPGYKARHLDFQKTLNQIMGNKLPLERTHPNHLPIGGKEEALPIIKVKPDPGTGLDGNNVQLDEEMSDLAVNQLLYNTYAQILARRLGWLKDAIEGVK